MPPHRNHKFSICALPPSVLIHVASHLDPDSIVSFMTTCKALLRALSSNGAAWKAFFVQNTRFSAQSPFPFERVNNWAAYATSEVNVIERLKRLENRVNVAKRVENKVFFPQTPDGRRRPHVFAFSLRPSSASSVIACCPSHLPWQRSKHPTNPHTIPSRLKLMPEEIHVNRKISEPLSTAFTFPYFDDDSSAAGESSSKMPLYTDKPVFIQATVEKSPDFRINDKSSASAQLPSLLCPKTQLNYSPCQKLILPKDANFALIPESLETYHSCSYSDEFDALICSSSNCVVLRHGISGSPWPQSQPIFYRFAENANVAASAISNLKTAYVLFWDGRLVRIDQARTKSKTETCQVYLVAQLEEILNVNVFFHAVPFVVTLTVSDYFVIMQVKRVDTSRPGGLGEILRLEIICLSRQHVTSLPSCEFAAISGPFLMTGVNSEIQLYQLVPPYRKPLKGESSLSYHESQIIKYASISLYDKATLFETCCYHDTLRSSFQQSELYREKMNLGIGHFAIGSSNGRVHFVTPALQGARSTYQRDSLGIVSTPFQARQKSQRSVTMIRYTTSAVAFMIQSGILFLVHPISGSILKTILLRAGQQNAIPRSISLRSEHVAVLYTDNKIFFATLADDKNGREKKLRKSATARRGIHHIRDELATGLSETAQIFSERKIAKNMYEQQIVLITESHKKKKQLSPNVGTSSSLVSWSSRIRKPPGASFVNSQAEYEDEIIDDNQEEDLIELAISRSLQTAQREAERPFAPQNDAEDLDLALAIHRSLSDLS